MSLRIDDTDIETNTEETLPCSTGWLEKEDRIEQMLAEMKARRQA